MDKQCLGLSNYAMPVILEYSSTLNPLVPYHPSDPN